MSVLVKKPGRVCLEPESVRGLDKRYFLSAYGVLVTDIPPYDREHFIWGKFLAFPVLTLPRGAVFRRFLVAEPCHKFHGLVYVPVQPPVCS